MASDAASKPTPIDVRRANPDDLEGVADLIRLTTERNYSDETIARMVRGLREPAFYAWLGIADNRSVGITMLESHALIVDGRVVRAGYWNNLYIRPEYRKSTLYPRLVRTMFRESAAAGIDVIYSGIRRKAVADAHVAVGLTPGDTYPVLAKPLRPVRLIVKHAGLPRGLLVAAPIVDGLYGTILRMSWRFGRRFRVEESQWSSADIQAIVDLYRRSVVEGVHHGWTAESFADRYAFNPDGDKYRMTCARDPDSRILAAVVFRLATRGKDICTGVVLDVIGLDPRARHACIAAAESRMMEAGADVVLAMGAPQGAAPRTPPGYRRTKETYTLLYRASPSANASLPSRMPEWRFTFGDHDAF